MRAAPALTAEVRSCWADGVLFRTEGRTEFVDGRQWVEVTPPGGEPGWAAAEFLEFAPAAEKAPVGYAVETHPDEYQTGIAAVDRVIGAVVSGDVVRMLDLVRFWDIGCVATHLGEGSPPECFAGEDLGTLVSAASVAECDLSLVRREHLPTTLAFFAIDSPRLVAVYRADPILMGDYGIIFATDDGGAVTVFLRDEGIATFWLGCPFRSLRPQLEVASDFVLPPLD